MVDDGKENGAKENAGQLDTDEVSADAVRRHSIVKNMAGQLGELKAALSEKDTTISELLEFKKSIETDQAEAERKKLEEEGRYQESLDKERLRAEEALRQLSVEKRARLESYVENKLRAAEFAKGDPYADLALRGVLADLPSDATVETAEAWVAEVVAKHKKEESNLPGGQESRILEPYQSGEAAHTPRSNSMRWLRLTTPKSGERR